MEKTKQIELRWNQGKEPLMFVHPQSVAHGLNLQEAAQHVCLYSLTYNYEHWDQLIRRIYRQGNKFNRVFVHQLVAEDTVDDLVIVPTIKTKRSDQGSLFQALKNLRK